MRAQPAVGFRSQLRLVNAVQVFIRQIAAGLINGSQDGPCSWQCDAKQLLKRR